MDKKVYGELKYSDLKKSQSNRKDQRWLLINVSPHVIIKLKRMFPRISPGQLTGKATNTFSFDDTLDIAVDLDWLMKRYPFQVNKETLSLLKKRVKQYHKQQEACLSISTEEYEPPERPGIRHPHSLRHHQNHSVSIVEIVSSSIIVDDVGLGKTYSAAGMATLPNALPMILVCEPHLQDQMVGVFKSFLNLRVAFLDTLHPKTNEDGSTEKISRNIDILIVKYNQLTHWISQLIDFNPKSIAFDEIQNLRTGGKSDKGIAAKIIADHCEYVTGYTGTLIYNYGVETWEIFNVVRPGLLGNRTEFEREWCNGNDKVVTDPDALGAYLIDNFAVIRHKKEISQNQYPQHEIVNVEPDIEQLESAQKLAEDLAMRVITAQDYNESGIASRQFDIQMRKMTGLAKARACAASAKILLDRGLPVILFGYHRAVYQIWEEEFANYNPMYYTGKQTPSQKKKAKQAFIDGNTNLLIMSIRSGIGVDGLQYRAPWIVIGEFDWSKAVHIQNIGRGDRDGNPNPQECGVIFVATNYGSDPVMQSILGIKSNQGRGIQDPKSGQTEVAINNQLTPGRFKEMAKSFLTSQGVTIPKDLISDKSNAELAELF